MRTKDMRALLEDARRTGRMPPIGDADMRLLRLEARRMGVKLDVTEIQRTPNDCMRMAITHAYGAAYGFDYADTPDLVLQPQDDPQVQINAWREWGEARGLGLWFSNVQAPVGASRWIGMVASRVWEGATHALAMEFDHLAFDPMEGGEKAWSEVRREDLVSALMFIPVGDPAWQAEPAWWRIGRTAA